MNNDRPYDTVSQRSSSRDQLPPDLRQLLQIQNSPTTSEVRSFAVLPPLQKTPSSSDVARRESFVLPAVPSPVRRRTSLESDLDNLSVRDGRRSVPIAPPINYRLDLDRISDDELLPLSSSSRSTEREMDDHQQMLLQPLQFATIPNKLPDVPGLSQAIDNLSSRRLTAIVHSCKLYDTEDRGYLSSPTIVKCIGEVVPSAHTSSSPWRILLDELAPSGELIHYRELAALIEEHKKSSTIHLSPSLPDVLSKRPSQILSHLPIRPSTSQLLKEQGRAQVMMDIESLLLRHPKIDIDRLKMATTQKIITISEVKDLLHMYELEQHFKPFAKRLFSSFLTHDGRFHFSAFVGCLENVLPNLRQSAPATLQLAPWESTPLSALSHRRTSNGDTNSPSTSSSK